MTFGALRDGRADYVLGRSRAPDIDRAVELLDPLGSDEKRQVLANARVGLDVRRDA